MDWHQFRKMYKEKHGPTSLVELSKAYRRASRAHRHLGLKTRGWKKQAPKRGQQRHSLLQKCGSSAFLLPKEEKFPVMNRQCRYQCNALNSAYNRAQQYKYSSVASTAKKLLNQFC